MIFTILSTISPFILWGMKIFFKNDADRREAAIRFLKFVEARKDFGKKSVKLNKRYEALQARLKDELAKKNMETNKDEQQP